MRRKVYLFLELFVFAVTISSRSHGQTPCTKIFRSYWGSYTSYDMQPESVQEMTYQVARKLLHKKMIIDSSYFTLFHDTVANPNYVLDTMTKKHFFIRYFLNERRFNFLSDTITSLLVQKGKLFEETRIILAGDRILANYGGYFFFFRKDK